MFEQKSNMTLSKNDNANSRKGSTYDNNNNFQSLNRKSSAARSAQDREPTLQFQHDKEEEEYDDKWMKKGSSPTKRLIQMKGAVWEHNKAAKDAQGKSNYAIKYTTSPTKTYVVEPKEGKIDYSQAKKKGFNEKVVNEQITKHKM